MPNIKKSGPQAKEASQTSFFSFILSLVILIIFVLGFKDSILDANNIPTGSMVPTLKIGDYLFINKMRYSLRVPFWGKEIFHISNPDRGDIVTFLPADEERKHYVKRVMGMPGDRIRILEVNGCKIRKQMHSSSRALLQERPSYNCSSESSRQLEPLVSIIEYQEKNQGPWKRYSITELPANLGHKELLDSDSESVLPLQYVENGSYYAYSQPVIYQEKVGNSTHLVVESSKSSDAAQLCPEIYTEGCLIPDEHYFVMGDNRDHSKDSRLIGFIHRENIYGKAVIIYFSINWRDDICSGYWHRFQEDELFDSTQAGFPLKDFPPEKQKQHCSEYDLYAQEQWASEPLSARMVFEYILHTLRYRIPRMSIRWGRIGGIIG